MTRFARAKGSKASNERIPEKSTPWAIMKQELLEKSHNLKVEKDEKEVNKQKITNYKKFLKEKEEEESKHTVWASFPVQRNKSLLLDNKSKKSFKAKTQMNDVGRSQLAQGKMKEKKLKLVLVKEKQFKNSISAMEKIDSSLHKNVKEEKKKDKKTGGIENKTKDGKGEGEQEHRIMINSVTKTKKKRSKQMKMGAQEVDSIKTKKIAPKNVSSINNLKKKKKNGKQMKDEESGEKTKNTKKLKNLKKEKTELTETDLKKIEKKKQKKIKQLLKKKQFKEKLKDQKVTAEDQKLNKPRNSKENETVSNGISAVKTTLEENNLQEDKNKVEKLSKKQMVQLKNKKKKISDGEPQRRKPSLPHKMFINGKELEISYVEGFPVKKEDAERLKKLRKEMISKGLPRSQIDAALKLERRRAEKSLAREKKKVGYIFNRQFFKFMLNKNCYPTHDINDSLSNDN